MSVSITSLCRGLPEELRKYLEYCRSLRFEDKPNYPYLRGLFREALDSHRYGNPALGFDWMRMKKSSSSGAGGGAGGDDAGEDAPNEGDAPPPAEQET